jgi:threonine synthase
MATSPFELECGKCSAKHDPARPQNTCTACGGPLLVRYALTAPLALSTALSRRPGQNRLHELSPLAGGIDAPTLGEGATPMLPGARLAAALDLPHLFIKDEAQNPTCSFKARGMAAAMGRAAELGIHAVCLPSAGNAGGAAAAYGALHGIDVHVYVPDSTPKPIIDETRALGAHVELVAGSIADAGAALASIARDRGWFSLATLREPYRVEGKKVMGFELLYDLGRLPDAIVYPTGGGTGIVGMWKAFDEMQALGWIGAERPKMISVQVEGCAPIVRAFEQGLSHAPKWENPAETLAYGLRVPSALGDFLMLESIRKSGGTAIAVREAELVEGTELFAKRLGIQASAEGGACIAAARRLRASGFLKAEDRVVVFNTGHALKYG